MRVIGQFSSFLLTNALVIGLSQPLRVDPGDKALAPAGEEALRHIVEQLGANLKTITEELRTLKSRQQVEEARCCGVSRRAYRNDNLISESLYHQVS